MLTRRDFVAKIDPGNLKMIKKITYNEPNRVETGAVKFGEDWPGLFLRGDDAFALSMEIFKLEQYFLNNAPAKDHYLMHGLCEIKETIQNEVVNGIS